MLIDEIKKEINGIGYDKFNALLIGSGAVYITGVKCVISFCPKEVVLSVKGGAATVLGEQLEIKKYCSGDVLICGKITSITKE